MLRRAVYIASMAVIFIITLTVVGAFYTRNFLAEEPSKTTSSLIMNHISLMKNNDVLVAYQLGSVDFQYATTFREFSRFAERYYSIFRNSTKSHITSNVINGDKGNAKVELIGSDKGITTLDYIFVKEEKAWKILNLTINPPPPHPAVFDDSPVNPLEMPAMTGYYDNTENRYTINFPERWDHQRLDNGTLILTGMSGTRSYYSSVNIQAVLTKKSGGRFNSVKNLIDDIKRQVETLAKNPIFLEAGPVEVNEKSGAKAIGEYLIFTYTYNGDSYQQWNVVVSRDDGQLFYVWAYTSPIKQYTNNLPLAKAILNSWKIY